jgi:predicted RNA-binding Zn-ribbon protein involved in translation (DUF1610 family)
MEDVLDVYRRPFDEQRPLVCLDEFCKQLLAEVATPLPTRPGVPARYDYEYIRKGSATAFMIYAPLVGTRKIFISENATRTKIDYAQALRLISDEMFPHAEKIILVEDNLNTHNDGSLYEAFEPVEARRLAQRFERHHTPKHGSWLDIAESEISAVLRTSISARVESREKFEAQCGAAEEWRNRECRKTDWHFTCEDSRIKLTSLYPSFQN